MLTCLYKCCGYFYPWFKFYFPKVVFGMGMVLYADGFETKVKPRMKLNQDIYMPMKYLKHLNFKLSLPL